MDGVDLDHLPYSPLVPYNGTGSLGGDPLEENLNIWYESGDIAFIIFSTALVLLMIPGVGYVFFLLLLLSLLRVS